jgi:hypothetical protein
MSGDVTKSMMKSELIELMARKQNHLAYKDIELAVKSMLAASVCIFVLPVLAVTRKPVTRLLYRVSTYRISSPARN